MAGSAPRKKSDPEPGLLLRLDLGPGVRIGPGKVRLLELIDSEGSISAAARAMNMSYRRAWLLVHAMNEAFCEPVVSRSAGGRHGGGAQLTPLGATLLAEYRRIESAALRVADGGIARLRGLLRTARR